MFETFGVPALYVANEAVLQLYALGRTTGVVLDCGHHSASAVPVHEGYAMEWAVPDRKFELAGVHLSEYLTKLLKARSLMVRVSDEFPRSLVRTCGAGFSPRLQPPRHRPGLLSDLSTFSSACSPMVTIMASRTASAVCMLLCCLPAVLMAWPSPWWLDNCA